MWPECEKVKNVLTCDVCVRGCGCVSVWLSGLACGGGGGGDDGGDGW